MTSMKGLVLRGPGDLSLETVPKPTARFGSVVVKVTAAPVWDYVPEVVKGEREYPLAYPLIFGTCCVGRVEEVGQDVHALLPGQLVFCDYIVRQKDDPDKRIVLGYHGGFTPSELAISKDSWRDGCFADFARFPAENVHPIDPKLSLTPFELTEIASLMPAMGAANAISIQPGETVLVLPATGFFSSSAVAVALALGANVVVGGRSQESLDALVKGFDEGQAKIRTVVITGDVMGDMSALVAATPGGLGADAYIDFSPPAAATSTHIYSGLMALKRYGRCCFAGVILENVSLPYAVIMSHCLTIRGQFAQDRADVTQTIRLIESGNLRLRKKILGPFPLARHQEAFEAAVQSKGWEKMVVLTTE